MQKLPIITIDGPSASGKGTIAKRVADILGWDYLDSGALYRLSALYVIQHNIPIDQEDKIAQVALNLPSHFEGDNIFLDGENVSDLIRNEEVGMITSKIATYPALRQALLQRQRDFATPKGLVTDGRDMGSVVFPNAILKIFLTASAQVRAERRINQLKKMGKDTDFSKILADIQQRDTNDINRKESPLIVSDPNYQLDTSTLSIEETVKIILNWYEKIKDLGYN